MGGMRLRAGVLVASALAVVAGGIVAPGFASAAPIVPTGLSPNDPNAAPTASTAGTPIKNVVLTWSPLANVTSYEVQVSDEDGSFVNPGADATTAVPSYAPPSSLPHGDYAWRVRASGGVWSSPAYFTRGWTAAPGNPHLVGPDKDNAFGPVLTWDPVADASYYEVEFSDRPFVPGAAVDAGDSSPGIAGSNCYTANTVFTPYVAVKGKDPGITDESTFKCTELIGGPFYWRVRARDGAFDPRTTTVTAPADDCSGVWYGTSPIESAQKDDCSAWAYPTVPDFTSTYYLGTTAPATPTNVDIGPRAGSDTDPVTISSTPVYTWDPTPNTSFYRVYESRTPDMTTLDHQWDTTASTLAPVTQDPDRSVRSYWSVQACVVAALTPIFVLTYPSDPTVPVNCSAPSPWHSFVQSTPANVQPISTSGVVNGGRTFTWSTALIAAKPNGSLSATESDVKGYEIQISDSRGSFATPNQSILVDRQGNVPGQSSTTIAVSALPAAYEWRVRGVDSTGNDRPWSAATTVGTLQSASARITTAGGFGLKAPLTVSFDAPVDGVASSSLRIVSATSGGAVPAVVEQTGDTTYTVTPTGTWSAGTPYRVAVTTAVVDADNTVPATASAATVRASTTVDSSSVALTKHTGDYGWTTLSASTALGGSYLLSNDNKATSARSYVQASLQGTKLYVYACKGTTSGKAGLYVDGALVATLDLYNSYTTCGRIATITLGSASAHSVRFAPLGIRNARSTSTAVRFDGFVVA